MVGGGALSLRGQNKIVNRRDALLIYGPGVQYVKRLVWPIKESNMLHNGLVVRDSSHPKTSRKQSRRSNRGAGVVYVKYILE